MERSIHRNGIVNTVILLLVGAAALAVARTAHSLAGVLVSVFIGIGFLVSALSWFQMRLEERERLEKLEVDELARGRGGSALFGSTEEDAFPARRAREQFERFFVPGFTILLFLAEAIGAYLLWRYLSGKAVSGYLTQPTLALALFGLFALVLFLLGKFSATMARLEDHRLLRPGASWLLLGAYLCFLAALGVVGVELGLPRADAFMARGFCILLGLIALETLVNLILEIYRPRLKGKVSRPVYESRLVGLLGQPEGLITTAAQALDYQFGFKVSETWFYRFFERALGWLILLQVGVLLLSTCFVVVETGEQALLERFGKPVAGRHILMPGIHFKLPWPIDRAYRYQTERIQSFNVGFTPDPRLEGQPVVLWTVAHTEEENFLVANRDEEAAAAETEDRQAPPVSLLTVSIPVQFQITNVIDWAYNNSDPARLLEDIATREVIRYLVGADLNQIMSRQRGGAAEALRERIQEAANARRLGARITFVGLQDIHPPVKVAPDYEKVIAASHQRQTMILGAQAEAIRTNAMAVAQATNAINQAIAEKVNLEVDAFSRAAQFTNQIPAYRAAPRIYMERSYLQAFVRATADARKYFNLTTNMHNVYQFDLQDSVADRLLNPDFQPAD
ncbi:MAG TPA: protease modulator HflK [Verrucomicrobia bacterium]|nr:protease modulator HflK [Verrucomicrobiota bacterium]HOB32188.1 protease modulator HflK [Verrucomicrobiota bacterium]HOP96721.1 protease modulator HflK [Verrucomicrobiota bacterium]HPU56249.1 protease modulator HflK [Verrucomicrobiota bacterium]